MGDVSHVSDFCSDYFFHYLLYHSPEVRLLLARHLSSHKVAYTSLTYNDEYPRIKVLKKAVLDVVFKDNRGFLYSAEMQNGFINRSEIVRFIHYGALLLQREIQRGGSYNVKSIHMLIIYTGKPIHQLNHFTHHLEFMDRDYRIVLRDGPIHIEIIQTQRMEELSMETVLRNPFHQFIHLFENEENHKKVKDNKMCEDIINMYREYVNSDDYFDYCRIERERLLYNTDMMNAKEEGIQEGVKLGREEGIEEGLELGKKEGIRLGEQKGIRNKAREFITRSYGTVDLKWLDQCTEKQIDYIFEIVFDKLPYDDFKTKILSI